MTQQQLDKILVKHKKWLDGEDGGEMADLRGAYLRESDLYGADLRESDLYGADLYGADLYGADLRGADLRGADIDHSCLPMWCGGLHMKTDRRLMAQIAYHFCAQDCDDPDYIKARNAILDFANSFHRVEECGVLKPIEVEGEQ